MKVYPKQKRAEKRKVWLKERTLRFLQETGKNYDVFRRTDTLFEKIPL